MNPQEITCPTCGSNGLCWDKERNDCFPLGIFHRARISKSAATKAEAMTYLEKELAAGCPQSWKSK